MLKQSLYLSLIASFCPLFLITNGVAISSPLVSSPQLLTQTPKTPQQIAQAITVRVYAGDNSGSGVLIAQNGQTYTVITNAHVVKQGQPYRIQTPDGTTHTATLQTAEDSVTGNDLALLQFESPNAYSLATLAPAEPVTPNQTVLAAGFPYDSPQLSISEGKVTLMTPKPIVGGYQIGFTNPTQQGMSGGVLLNQQGQLIGLLGKGNAILATAYDYQDGTKPDETLLKQMQQASFAIPIEPVAFLAKLYTQEGADTQIPRQVNQIAQQITVRIDVPSQFDGSGVIVGKNGQTYYVLTARHVVEGQTDLKIITPDGTSHVVKKEGVKAFEGVDIGVVEFTSPETYQVATLADYPLGKFKTKKEEIGFDIQNPLIFLSGFPLVKSGNPSRKFTSGIAFTEYQNLISTKDQYSLTQGLELVYSALSLPGMSGGAVLDQQGRLIGINAAAEHESLTQEAQTEDVIYFGTSLGVPIKTFLGQLQKGNLNPQWFKVETKAPETLSSEQINQVLKSLFTQKPPTESSSAVEWFNYGRLQARMDQHETALEAYDQAIKRNPQLYQAYYSKGRTLFYTDVNAEALAAFDKATEIEPNFYIGWYWKAQVLQSLGKYSEALAAVDRSIQNQPQEPKSYLLRGAILEELERDPEAEEAYTEAIKEKPNAQSYILRGSARKDWGDKQGAIADYTQAIELQPNFSNPYILRSLALNDSNPATALKDAETAIQLDPDDIDGWVAKALVLFYAEDYQGVITTYTKIIDTFFQDDPKTEVDLYGYTIGDSYRNLSNAYWKLGNADKAIAGYNKVIELEPNYAFNYHLRGVALAISQKSCPSAVLADFNKAIELEPDNATYYNSRALCFEISNNPDQALTDYKKVVEIATQKIKDNPYNPDNYLLRGTARKKLGDPKEAEEDIQKGQQLKAEGLSGVGETHPIIQKFREKQKRMQAYYTQEISKNPNNANLYFYRGIVAHNLRDYQSALEDFNRSLELDSKHPEAYYHRGLTHQSLQENQKAIEDFTQALKLNISEDTNVYDERGSVYLAQQNYSQAIEDFTQVINRLPNYSDLYLKRGLAYSANKEYELALQDFNQLIDLVPNNSMSYFQRGAIYQKQGNLEKALADYKLAVEKDEKLVDAILKIGDIYNEKGDSDLAFNQFQQAIKLQPSLAETESLTKQIESQPNNAVLYVLRGHSYVQKEDLDAALKDYNQAIEIDPKFTIAYLNRGFIYYKKNDFNQALIAYNKAIEINPDFAETYFYRGVISQKQGDYDKALADYQLAVEKDEKLVAATLNTGMISYEKGDIESALQQWEKAIKISPDFPNLQLALAVVLYSRGEQNKSLEMAKAALLSNQKLADIDYLKQNLWGDKIITEAQKLLQHPEIASILKK